MKKDDLISRAAAVRALASSNGDYLDALERLEKIPAVDDVQVVHGRWLEERPNTFMRKVKCSVCNGPAPFICRSADYYGRNMHGDFAKTKYCPCCGAKMDGERRDSE